VSSSRKSALTAGVFFIVAAITAIVGLALYDPILNDSRYIVDGSADDTQVLLGAVFEVMLAISVVGTAAALFPIVRRQGEGIALGYAVARFLEAALIVVGIISLLSIVTLRQDSAGAAGADADSLVSVGQSLVAIHDWTFLFGPGLALGVNTTLLAYLMYRSQLVPRPIARLGLIGGPMIFSSAMAMLFGLYEQGSAVSILAAIPVFCWEMSLAGWMIVKGFRPAPITSGISRRVAVEPVPA
jgi:hypothetical protein